MTLQVVVGKKIRPMDGEEFASLAARYSEVLIDLGTGDGRFVLHWARQHQNTLCIGIDALQEAMRECSRRAASKPQRGGVANALYVVAPIEQLPTELLGSATRITINFPWGSLLRALVTPEPRVLRDLAALGRPGAGMTVLINYSVFQDEAYRERLGLPSLDLLVSGEWLARAWRRAGIVIDRRSLLDREVPHRTSWGQRLILGSERSTLLIEATVLAPSRGITEEGTAPELTDGGPPLPR